MRAVVLLDTGPLVAALDKRDQYHLWAVAHIKSYRPPLLTCEAVLTEALYAVLTEALYLVRNLPEGTKSVMDLVRRQVLAVRFAFQEEAQSIAELMERYANIPMSFADACVVR